MANRVLGAVVALVALVGGASAAIDSRILVDEDTNFMVDKFGRVRFFHGINMVEKDYPWYPKDCYNSTWAAFLEEWGFNTLRLGTMWTGTEPEEGRFNESYLAVLDRITNNLAAHGIYTLLDMHQDVLSTKYESYDGAPRWLVDRSKPDHEYPWPLPWHMEGWFMHYFAEACGVAFQDIYQNNHGMQDAMARFWVKIATHFRGRDEILGYELLNEPWSGDIYKHPELLLPGIAGKRNLMPLYERINKDIRAVDDTTLLFYEPLTWGMFLDDGTIGSGFDAVPGGAQYNNRSVFSWHYYCWFKTDNGTGPYPPWEFAICDKLLGALAFKNVPPETKRIGGASFLTEFGLCDPDGSNSSDTVECEFIMNKADEALQSWQFWDRRLFDGQGNPRWKTVKEFARSYARAVAGIPLKMDFAPRTARFELYYSLNPSITQPTEIFLPALQYPRGFLVDGTPNIEWTTPASNLLHIRAKAGAQKGDLARVTVIQKP